MRGGVKIDLPIIEDGDGNTCWSFNISLSLLLLHHSLQFTQAIQPVIFSLKSQVVYI